MPPFYVRELTEYPTGAKRLRILTMAVLAILIGSYEAQIAPVVPLLLKDLNMSLTTYGALSAAAAIAGAVASIVGGRLTDQVGRVRLLVPMMLLTAVCCYTMVLVQSPRDLLFARALLAFVDGMAMASTAPLVRDFSPRMGRAQAFGFWTWGPVGANFLAAAVAAYSLPIFNDSWRSQFVIMGTISLVISLIIAFNIADLSPELRAQILDTDRRAIRAVKHDRPPRARDLFAHRHIWAHVVGIGLWLMLYLSLTKYGQTMIQESFGVTTAEASRIMAAFWTLDLLVLIVVGRLSDRLRLRKPFSFWGTAVSAAATIYLTLLIGRTDVSPTHLMITGALLGGALAMAYAPWMACYSENAEDIDPRLQGTAWGLFSFLSKSSSVLVLLFVPLLVAVIGWQGWMWISVVGLILYLPAVFLFKGPWRRRDVPVPADPTPTTAPIGD